MVCSPGTNACTAKKVGDCCVHPMMDSMMAAMENGASWFNINDQEERRILRQLTPQQRAEKAVREKEAEAQAAELVVKAEECREAQIFKTQAMKAVNDAKDLSRSFAKNKLAANKVCTWVKLQEEAEKMLVQGYALTHFITQPTPGQRKKGLSERETIKSALRGCIAATSGACPFCKTNSRPSSPAQENVPMTFNKNWRS